MGNITFLVFAEIIILVIIIISQFYSFLSTRNKIKVLGSIIPKLNNFSIKKYLFTNDDINGFASKIVDTPLEYNKEFDYENDPFTFENNNFLSVNLISSSDTAGLIFSKIQKALNMYLLRNKGSVADFNLMQDVVNRNVDTEEDEITNGLNMPLYLGLMGTMIGIIIGLANLTSSDTSKGDEFDPSAFLMGVAIAMIASFIGLLFTVLNSKIFKDAKKEVETCKNDFYTFLQTELMPVVNSSVSNAVYTLKDVVVNFNKDFAGNLNVLNKMFDKSYNSLKDQASILDKLEDMDIKQFASANVKILKELSNATEKLHSFQLYVDSLNSMMSNTNQATLAIRDLLGGVNNFSELAGKLDTRVEESTQLLQFATDHITYLKDNSAQVKGISNDFSDFTEQAMKTLENVSSGILTNFRKFAEDETAILRNSIESRPDQFEQLNHLEHLKNIDSAMLEQKSILEEKNKSNIDQNDKLLQALLKVESAVSNIKISIGKDSSLLPEEERKKMIELVDAQMMYLEKNAISRLFPYNRKNKS